MPPRLSLFHSSGPSYMPTFLYLQNRLNIPMYSTAIDFFWYLLVRLDETWNIHAYYYSWSSLLRVVPFCKATGCEVPGTKCLVRSAWYEVSCALVRCAWCDLLCANGAACSWAKEKPQKCIRLTFIAAVSLLKLFSFSDFSVETIRTTRDKISRLIGTPEIAPCGKAMRKNPEMKFEAVKCDRSG